MGIIVEKARRKNANLRLLSKLTVFGVFAYLILFGAMNGLHARNCLDDRVYNIGMQTIFSPLVWIANRNETFRDFLFWCEFLWLR